MFEQAFRNIDDALRKEAGCTTELDYTEQTPCLLFLKYPAKPYRWDTWAAPKKADGSIDDMKAMGSADSTDFVDDSLFPYLQKFKQSATSAKTIEYKIGEIFSKIKNMIKNMGNASRNGGQYYTPRPLIRVIIQTVRPELGQKIYDGAVGSADFLCQAYDYLRKQRPKSCQRHGTFRSMVRQFASPLLRPSDHTASP